MTRPARSESAPAVGASPLRVVEIAFAEDFDALADAQKPECSEYRRNCTASRTSKNSGIDGREMLWEGLPVVLHAPKFFSHQTFLGSGIPDSILRTRRLYRLARPTLPSVQPYAHPFLDQHFESGRHASTVAVVGYARRTQSRLADDVSLWWFRTGSIGTSAQR
jgi:hypothetical protein